MWKMIQRILLRRKRFFNTVIVTMVLCILGVSSVFAQKPEIQTEEAVLLEEPTEEALAPEEPTEEAARLEEATEEAVRSEEPAEEATKEALQSEAPTEEAARLKETTEGAIQPEELTEGAVPLEAPTEEAARLEEAAEEAVPLEEQTEAEQAETLRANESVMISYCGHIQTYGWSVDKNNGERIGTVGCGKRLEALRIWVDNIDHYSGHVMYRSHVQTYGWETEWRSDGEISGTVGQSKRLEAVQIKLTGDLAQRYDVYYRVHVEQYGWLDWAKNGAVAGTSGYSKRIEAIEIMLADKGAAVSGGHQYSYISAATGISYQPHVQTYGWLSGKENGYQAGTVGQSKRLEALRIRLLNCPYEGTVEYQSHIQTYGWEKDWKRNGEMSGTVGQSKRLEAIRIRLTGELAEKCDIYYRVHCQRLGWLGWVKNGESAGTAGFSYRMEAIQILLLPKNARSFPEELGFVEKGTSSSYAQWNITEIETNLPGSGAVAMVGQPVELCALFSDMAGESITCDYLWQNNTTMESGSIGSAKQGEKVLWVPNASGNYTIRVKAYDPLYTEKTAQLPVTVDEGNISRADAFFTAHRGLSSQAPDNSIPAFILAGENGFDSIETDVHETKDGVFVISHDGNLKSICGVDKNISDLTYEELKNYGQYHIISGAQVEKYSSYDLRIPTLEEFLEICNQYGCIPQIDSKDLNSYKSIERLYAILVEYGVQDTAIITSYNNLYLQLLRRLNPNIMLTYGIDSAQYVDLDWVLNYQIGLSVNYSKLLSEDWSTCLEEGVMVNAYTVRDRQVACSLIHQGITAITTDRVLWNAAE